LWIKENQEKAEKAAAQAANAEPAASKPEE
jgi:hypothetical protein